MMAKTSNEEWELSKENIQPLQQGRKHGVLKVALTMQPDDGILQQRQAFEQELRTYSGNDPLSVWCKYIKWVEQNFPKGGRDGQIEKLLQKCLFILKDEKQYLDDNRFIEIWLKFAVVTTKPCDVYDYMYSHNIGCKSANFYVDWAWELEQQGNINKANQVLTEGLHRKAEPHEKIKSSFSEFEMRIASKVLSNPVHGNDPSENGRTAFSILKPVKKKAPIVRTGEAVCEPNKTSLIVGRQQAVPRSNIPSTKVPFKIYNAENIMPALPIKSENNAPFVLDSDREKENEKKPSKWNKVRAKQTSSCPTISHINPDFQVHHDEAPQPAFVPRSIPKVSDVLKERHDRPDPPMALFEPPDPKRKPMYDRNKIYCGAEELSLEELRAATWHKEWEKREKEKQIAEKEKLFMKQEEYIKTLQKQVELLKQVPTAVNSKPSVLSELKDEQPITKMLIGNKAVLNHTSSCERGQLSIGLESVVSLEIKTQESTAKMLSTNAAISDQPDNCNRALPKKVAKSLAILETKHTEKSTAEMPNGKASISDDPDSCNRALLNIEPKSLVLLEAKHNEKSFPKMPNGNVAISDNPSSGNGNQPSIVPKSLVLLETKDTQKPSVKNFHTTTSLFNLPDKFRNDFKDEDYDVISKTDVSPGVKGVEKNTKMNFNSLGLPTNVESNFSLHKFVPQKDLSSDGKLSSTYHEAEHMVRELYDGTFFNPTENITNAGGLQNELYFKDNVYKYLPLLTEPAENKKSEDPIGYSYPLKSCPLINNEQKEPFTFYHDHTENIPKSKIAKAHDLPGIKHTTDFCLNQENDFLPDDNRENIPPVGYVQEIGSRELNGVLEPSKNVPYIPLELQEELDEEQDAGEDVEDDYIYNNNCPLQDETIIPPCNTEVFLAAAFLHPTSTPRTQVKKRKLILPVDTGTENQDHKTVQSDGPPKDNCNDISVLTALCNAASLQTALDEKAENKQMCKVNSKMGIGDQSILAPFQGQLSLIMESSRENYKSSSSSGSSAGATQLSQFYGQDQSNIDPFNEEFKKNLLQSLNLSADMTKQIKVSNKYIPELTVNSNINVGDFTYIIKNVIFETTYGKVYAVVSSNNKGRADMGLKVYNKQNDWEFYICTALHKRLQAISVPSYILKSVMNVTAGERYTDGLVLAFELEPLGSLADFVKLYKEQIGTIPETLVMYLTFEMLQIVSKLHECNIILGNVKPENILLCEDILRIDLSTAITERKTVIKFIEFNQAIDLKFFKKGICFQKAPHDGFSELLENKPWVFQPDWYGLLNCVHLLLFSECMKLKKSVGGRWSIEKKFKRFWDQTVWGPLFDELLNISSCYEEPDIVKHASKIESKLQQNIKYFQSDVMRLAKLYS